jgi:hypothetical protein
VPPLNESLGFCSLGCLVGSDLDALMILLFTCNISGDLLCNTVVCITCMYRVLRRIPSSYIPPNTGDQSLKHPTGIKRASP